jgi:ATP-binding cassette, subfamily C, bacterial CydC
VNIMVGLRTSRRPVIDVPRAATLYPVLLGVIAQLSAVGLMALSGWLLSRAAQHPPVLYLMTAIVGVRALGIARGVFRYRERLAGHDLALGLQAKLRVRAYQRLAEGQPLRRSGDLLARVTSDLDAIQDLVVRVIVPVASTAVVIIAAGAALSIIAPAAGLLALAGSAVSGALVPWAAARLAARAADHLVPLRARLADEVAEVGRGREDLVAYGADRAALGRLAAVAAELSAAERRTAWTAGLMSALQWLCTGAVIIGSVIIGGRAVAAGELDPVFLAVLALTPLALHEAIAGLPATAVTWRRTRAALRRVAELITPSAAASPSSPSPADRERPLVTRDLVVGWPGSEPVVRDLDLVIEPGERVALVGPSGIGKSTVAATLMGFIPPLGGTVRVTDRIGYLAQDAHIFDTSVAENVRIGARDADDDQVLRALAAVDLDFDLERMAGEFGTDVSGGEARRLAISRLAVSRLVDGDHDLLLLDEPTEHLDSDAADQVLDLLWRLDRRAAILVITHDPRVMERCDRIVDLRAVSPAR